MAWWKHLYGKPFYHLFDEDYPPARLFMLERMISRRPGTPSQAEAELALREWSVARDVVAQQHPAGWWDNPDTVWAPRYTATLWQLRLLAEFGVPGDDETIATGVDYLLDHAPAPGETLRDTVDTGAPPVNLNAIIVYVPLTFRFHNDPRVQYRLSALTASILENAIPDEPAQQLDWAAQAAAALARAPAFLAERNGAVTQVADILLTTPVTEFPDRWQRFGAPVFDTPDLLFAARALIELGVRDRRLTPWIEFIVARQRDDERGGLSLERSRYEAAGLQVEEEGAFSKWLTAQALFVMREWYGE